MIDYSLTHPIMAKYYTLVPLPIGAFEGLSPVDRLVWGTIWERWRLSSYNVTGTPGDSPWYDHNVEAVYCVFSHAALAEAVGVNERTIRRSLNALQERELLYWRKATYKGTCRYYIPEAVARYMRSIAKEDNTESGTRP